MSSRRRWRGSRTWSSSKGFARPTGYSNGPRDFERMCQQPDIDLVFTATPWEWHAPVMLAAMHAGKHTVTEVPMCTTMEECWELLETSERTGKLCLMMENCVYDRPEMLCLNLVRLGMLGEVLHGECGYLHDLRSIKFADSGEGLWRRAHAVRRNANLYPTHGLGPIAQCMDIHRGDRFDYLVSMSSNSRGLRAYAAEHFPAGHPKRDEYYSLGDINTSLIRTVKGKTIILGHNCDNPRPYSRVNIVQGTKGIFEGYPNRVMIEGRSRNTLGGADGVLQGVRAPALEVDARPAGHHRARRHGLPGGLAADPMPAGGPANRPNRVRRRGLERDRRAHDALGGQPRPVAGCARFHPRQVADDAAARHRRSMRRVATPASMPSSRVGAPVRSLQQRTRQPDG